MKFKHLPTKNNRITSTFKMRTLNGKTSFHNGLDFGAIVPGVDGDDLYSVDDNGIVVVSKANAGNPKTGYGYYLIIQYIGYCVLYAHMQKLGLKVGTRVKAGDVVGKMGNSGNSTATHLHLEVRTGNYSSSFFTINSLGKYLNSVDPQPLLQIAKPETVKVEPVKPVLEPWEKLVVSISAGQATQWTNRLKELRNASTIERFLPELLMKAYEQGKKEGGHFG